MKKVDVEKKISKSMIMTGIVLLVMFCMVLIEKGYVDIHFTLKMNTIMLVSSIGLLVCAAGLVALGFLKSQKFFEASAWCAGLATLSMLIKIDHEAKQILSMATGTVNQYALIKIKLPAIFSFVGTVTLYDVAQTLFFVYLVALWIHTIYCINKK